MGLEEKRLIAEAQVKWIAEAKGYVQQYIGESPAFEVDWNSFTEKDAIMNFHFNGLGRVWEAVHDAAKDDFSKDAIKTGLKKIVMKNVPEANLIKVSGADGVLTVDAAYGKSEYAAVADIRKAIEGML
jgi:hypothetical protein